MNETKIVAAENGSGLRCGRCNVPLAPAETRFSYLNHDFTHVVPKCPQCGAAYVSEELTRGRITEVETMLEDK